MSEESNLTTALYRLNENEKATRRVETKLDEFIVVVNERFDELNKTLGRFQSCPKPGLCVVLEEKIRLDERDKAEYRQRLVDLEQKVFYNDGFGRGIMWVIAIGGSLVGSLIMFVITRIFHS